MGLGGDVSLVVAVRLVAGALLALGVPGSPAAQADSANAAASKPVIFSPLVCKGRPFVR
jgi:hypothetical protein